TASGCRNPDTSPAKARPSSATTAASTRRATPSSYSTSSYRSRNRSPMRSRPLPGLALEASMICLGCADYGSRIGEPDAFALLDAFVECGGNFLDTAHIYGAWDKRGAAGGYGNSELVIGRWIRSRGCRASLVLGTKGGHPDFDTGESRLSERALLR